jgi:hypothetical protein
MYHGGKIEEKIEAINRVVGGNKAYARFLNERKEVIREELKRDQVS